MVLRFSMDLSDYGCIAVAVVFTILWAAAAFAVVQLMWLHIPWREICQGTVRDAAYIMLSLALRLLSEGCFVFLAVRGFIRDITLAMLDWLRSAVRSFLDLPPTVHHLQG
ncbi:hypothetical protein EDD16DRAFT_1667964 [Pisolithus croceorrhizus]|nr:hypothetical protein EV401DRAFT_2041270 [Pisolithus croceorrhizus]KAI6097612.1 hypothetical protein EDD16DRAFT_1667964 [Pisolithus croceorrhizus]